MPLPRRSLIAYLLATCFVVGCDPGEPGDAADASGNPVGTIETRCTDGADDDADGLIDCDDGDCRDHAACQPPAPAACRIQADCGDRVNQAPVRLCLENRCVAPGLFDPATGDPKLTESKLAMVFDQRFTMGARPLSAVVRLFWPEEIGGAPVTCDGLQARSGSSETTRSMLDRDERLNQVHRAIFSIVWSGATSGEFVLPHVGLNFVPRGKPYLLYAEAWYGSRSGHEPTGKRAAVFCQEGLDFERADPRPVITFRP